MRHDYGPPGWVEYIETLEAEVSAYLERIRELEQLIIILHDRVFPHYAYTDPQTTTQLAEAEIKACRAERDEVQQENARLREQNIELEALARQHKIWYENELVLKEKLRTALERRKPKCSRGAIIGENIEPPEPEE